MADEQQHWTRHALDLVDPARGLWRVVVSPVIAALHFTVVYIGSSVYCLRWENPQLAHLRFETAALTAVAVVAIGFCAWAAWRRLRLARQPGVTVEERRGEVEFLSRITLYLAHLSWVGVLFVAAPLVILETCR